MTSDGSDRARKIARLTDKEVYYGLFKEANGVFLW